MVDVKADIYTTVGQFLYVKVTLDGGMYISGIKVKESAKFPGEVWTQMPSYKAGRNYKRYIEFAGSCELGQAIYQAIEDVCRPRLFSEETQSGSSRKSTKDVVINDIDDSPISLDDIPF
jgi:DNA-binding cell septation regulator SpoVG